jgi:MFS superfamily sulfate permease-like transporter
MKCAPGNSHFQAAVIGILTITTLLLWQKFAPKRISIIPAPLVAVVVASIFATVTGYAVLKIQVPANLLDQVSWPSAVSWQFLQTRDIWIAGAVLAAVASAETLLCATALDKMHRRGP